MRSEVRDDGADEKQRKADSSRYPDGWHADADQQPERPCCFEDAQNGNP